MSEIADMILDGFLCVKCGVAFDDIVAGEEGPGLPRTCEDCEGVKENE